MKKLFTLVILLLTVLCAIAQIGSFNQGARSAGLGGASATLGDEYSLFNNIGGIGYLENHSVFAGYQNRFGISEFQTIGAGAIYKGGLANAGVGFYRFGDELYSEQRIHLAVGNKIQMVSLGIGLDLLQYNISTIGSTHAIAIQFGGIVEISPQFRFAAHIFNLNQAKTSSELENQIPTVMKAGVSFLASEELSLNVEIEKDLEFDEVFKAGLEYEIIENVIARTGIRTKPSVGAFGIGFHPKNLKFDYAFSNDFRLGSIHDLSIAYTFNP